MKLVPLGDRVVLKAVAAEETTKSGIILAGAAGKEKPSQGDVVAVGTEVKLDNDEEFIVVKQSDILAIVK